MKNTILVSAIIVLAALSLGSFESAEARCYPGDPVEGNCPTKGTTSNYGILKAEMFEKQYCEIGGSGKSGIEFSADGRAYYFGHNLGAPNPATYFQVLSGTSFFHDSEAPFVIAEFNKADQSVVGSTIEHLFHRKLDLITSGQYQFSPKVCDKP